MLMINLHKKIGNWRNYFGLHSLLHSVNEIPEPLINAVVSNMASNYCKISILILTKGLIL